MINIAICDDDVLMTSSIEERLYKIGKEQDIKITCGVFFDGLTLIENIHQGTYYDIIYLDIEMQSLNGISAAKLIRKDEIPALIVYVSSYEQYMKKLFDTEPFRFLSKPIDEEAFQSVFMAAYRRIRQKSEYFSYTYNKQLIKIPLGRIHYFESQNRVVYIHVMENVKTNNIESDKTEYKFYGKMNDVEKTLSTRNARFIRIHQSYLVNFDYIKIMNYTSVSLLDGSVLQISEDRQKKVRAQFCTMVGLEDTYNE